LKEVGRLTVRELREYRKGMKMRQRKATSSVRNFNLYVGYFGESFLMPHNSDNIKLLKN
jgi:hypothetical protein